MNGTVRLRTVTRRDIVTRVADSPICDILLVILVGCVTQVTTVRQ